MRNWEIKDVDGNVLYSGKAKTKRGFLEQLVRSEKSLVGADLSRQDLSNLDLSGSDLRRVRFDGADMRGINISGADVSDASFAPHCYQNGNCWQTNLTGARADRTNFDGSDFTDAIMVGVRATYASFRGCNLTGAQIDDASASSSNFSRSRCEGTSFQRSSFVNADFQHSLILNCDFRGTRLAHRAFGDPEGDVAQKFETHLPDRTRGARIVGCEYDVETELSPTVPGFVSDRRVSKLTRFGLWASSTGSLVAGGDFAIEQMTHAATQYGFAHATAFIAVMGAVYLAKEAGGEWLRDKADAALGQLTSRIRSTLDELDRRGARRLDLVVAMAKNMSLDPLRIALKSSEPEAKSRGFFSLVRSFVGDLGQVVICDRKHLALALGTLCLHRERAFSMKHDVVIMRCDGAHRHSWYGPCAITFHKDGTSSTVWPAEGAGHLTVRYGQDGSPTGCWDAHGKSVPLESSGLPEAAISRLEAALSMEAALLADHDLHNFSYPRGSHEIRDGRDGSIIIHRISDRRIDNPHDEQPALIRVDGTGAVVRQGQYRDEWIALEKSKNSKDSVEEEPCPTYSM